jgi:hypothetical protein
MLAKLRGTNNYSWIVSPSRKVAGHGSKIWHNICNNWLCTRAALRPLSPANDEEWRLLPIWHPHLHHLSKSKACCRSNPERQLSSRGINTVGDVLDAAGNIIQWQNGPHLLYPRSCKRAYERILENIGPQIIVANDNLISVHLEDVGTNRVWEYRMRRCDATRVMYFQSEPIHSYLLRDLTLLAATLDRPESTHNLLRIITGRQQTKAGVQKI